MTVVKCWFHKVLLNDVLLLIFLYDSSGGFGHLLGLGLSAVLLHCFNTLLDFKVLFHILTILFLLLVQLLPQILDFRRYENTFSLRARLRLTDEQDWWLSFRLLLRHLVVLDHLFTLFHFLLGVLLDIMEFSRVHPGLREEVVMLRELLLESLEMSSELTLTADVIHSQEVVDSLTRADGLHKLRVRSHAAVSPVNVPNKWFIFRLDSRFMFCIVSSNSQSRIGNRFSYDRLR